MSNLLFKLVLFQSAYFLVNNKNSSNVVMSKRRIKQTQKNTQTCENVKKCENEQESKNEQKSKEKGTSGQSTEKPEVLQGKPSSSNLPPLEDLSENLLKSPEQKKINVDKTAWVAQKKKIKKLEDDLKELQKKKEAELEELQKKEEERHKKEEELHKTELDALRKKNSEIEKLLNIRCDEEGLTKVKGKTIVKYDAETFLRAATDFLNEAQPDTLQAGEKIWGGIAYTVKVYWAKLKILVESHDAIRAFCIFTIPFHGDSEVVGILNSAFVNAENCHKSFYKGGLHEAKLRKYLKGTKVFLNRFQEIPPEKVMNALQPYLNGEKNIEDNEILQEVNLKKMYVKKKLFDKNYEFDYRCY